MKTIITEENIKKTYRVYDYYISMASSLETDQYAGRKLSSRERQQMISARVEAKRLANKMKFQARELSMELFK